MCTGAFADLRNTPSISQRLEHVTSPLLFRQPFRFFDCTLCKLCSLYSQLGCQLTVTEYLNAVAGLLDQTAAFSSSASTTVPSVNLFRSETFTIAYSFAKMLLKPLFGIRLVSGI